VRLLLHGHVGQGSAPTFTNIVQSINQLLIMHGQSLHQINYLPPDELVH
jgi:hypothetical protein